MLKNLLVQGYYLRITNLCVRRFIYVIHGLSKRITGVKEHSVYSFKVQKNTQIFIPKAERLSSEESDTTE